MSSKNFGTTIVVHTFENGDTPVETRVLITWDISRYEYVNLYYAQEFRKNLNKAILYMSRELRRLQGEKNEKNNSHTGVATTK